MNNEILLVTDKRQEKFLRKKTVDFDFEKFTAKEIRDLITRMRAIMRDANGIGLSANQIGLEFKMFVAEVPDRDGGNKFYSIFNPKIERVGEEKELMEEGCLSVPQKYGNVLRATNLTLTGFDKYGKPIRIKAWGLLAHVFQHEVDHLNGILFIDKAKKIQENPATEGLQKREEKIAKGQ